MWPTCWSFLGFFFCFFLIASSQSGIQIMWEALHDLLVNQHSDTLSNANWIYWLCWLLHPTASAILAWHNRLKARERVETGRSGPRLLLLILYLVFLQSRSGGNILIGVGERLKADATVKKKEIQNERQEEKTSKTQRSTQAPPFECVHMCAQGLI